MPILGESVVMVLHTCELHEVDGSALPYPLLSESYSLEVSLVDLIYHAIDISWQTCKQPTIQHGDPYHVSIFIDISQGNSAFVCQPI